VAHSMGGLVARYRLAQDDNWKLCRALITLGTPHRGAPKALDILANGIKVGSWRVTRPVPVLREWASVAELLPRYPAVLDRSEGTDGVLRRPHELPLEWLRGPAAAAA
jgi:pimeloyl-ACP methyl ester carboxylesterase